MARLRRPDPPAEEAAEVDVVGPPWRWLRRQVVAPLDPPADPDTYPQRRADAAARWEAMPAADRLAIAQADAELEARFQTRHKRSTRP